MMRYRHSTASDEFSGFNYFEYYKLILFIGALSHDKTSFLQLSDTELKEELNIIQFIICVMNINISNTLNIRI